MELKEWLKQPFKFTAIPVSVFAVLLYGSVFIAALLADQTAKVSKNLGGLDLAQAFDDLHRITARPHPYISHANDDVREYLLDRLKPIVASQPYIHLSDDLTSNASYVTSRGAAYFEGTNILVMIEGTDASPVEPGAVLFTAHYDSVSTAPGATDNGMGIVTLLNMAEYLSDPDRRPRRTAIFLFNNGEEDHLNGAHAFFEHPWSNMTSSFINLEGAAAGGQVQPMMFRATSLSAARSFGASSIKHPHGSVLSSDAFARGVIRSGTDYEVFAQGIEGEKAGLDGVDFAFYKNRALYHTPFDSIPGMGRDEGRKSLWAMMEGVRGAGLEMLNRDAGEDGGDTGVYFDVLKRAMISFPLRALFITNVLLLVLGPIIVTGLLLWIAFLSKKDAVAVENEEHPETPVQPSRYHRLVNIIGWLKFWISLLLVIGVNIALVACYVAINPYIVHSRPYLVLTSFMAISFLGISFCTLLADHYWPSPPSSLKGAMILELYFLTWVFMVIATVAVNNLHIGGVYLVTAWHLCAWMAAIVAISEEAALAGRGGEEKGQSIFDLVAEDEVVGGDAEPHRMVRGIMYEPAEQEGESAEEVETEPTEITPLMQQRRRRSTGGREYVVGVDGEQLLVNEHATADDAGYQEYGWWIFQMLLLIPLPALLLSEVTLVLTHSLKNTLVDGSSPVTVYGGLAALSILIFINLAPFSHKLHYALNLFVLIILVLVLAVAWSVFPFTQEAPLKVFFQQSVELDTPNYAAWQQPSRLSLNPTRFLSNDRPSVPQSSILSAKTIVTGVRGYVDKIVIPELPSSWGKDLHCEIDQTLRKGLYSFVP
ncbi:hypothetical protein NM688_g6793 [Phlebia brevispora]|uniref:Uncharacterized protein n=1 Tax=Phlebia brevispora TaxID=194682 RepID=A0ACC1SCE3_9APHY|nr:hypothetical protein NM688_g6793 [Phlebia brevispora]